LDDELNMIIYYSIFISTGLVGSTFLGKFLSLKNKISQNNPHIKVKNYIRKILNGGPY
jgi:hypothetical protein